MPLPLGEAPVGPDDAVPREVLVRRGEHSTDKPRCVRIDVPICPDESLGDRPHAFDDAGPAGVGLVGCVIHERRA